MMKKARKRQFRLRFKIEKEKAGRAERTEAAIEKLSRSDQEWFEEHPMAWYRVRPYKEGEYQGVPPPSQCEICVIRIYKDFYMRSAVGRELGNWLKEGGERQKEMIKNVVIAYGGPKDFWVR